MLKNNKFTLSTAIYYAIIIFLIITILYFAFVPNNISTSQKTENILAITLFISIYALLYEFFLFPKILKLPVLRKISDKTNYIGLLTFVSKKSPENKILYLCYITGLIFGILLIASFLV